MTLTFRARSVASVEMLDANAFCVVLAEDEDGDGDGSVLELQRALSFDEQDRKLGMDTYCICLDGGTHYGGVVTWSVTAHRLELHFDEEAADHFAVDGVVVELDDSAPKSLHDDVKRVLGQPSLS
jgi:hypothetical protein